MADPPSTYNRELLASAPRLAGKWCRLWAAPPVEPAESFLRQCLVAIQLTRARLQQEGATGLARRQEWVRALRRQLRRYRDAQTGVISVCADCRGLCCAQNVGTGELCDPVDLCLFALSEDVDLRRYARRTEGPGCVFLGAEGCALPVDTRPRVCVLYTCELNRRVEDRGLTDRLRLLYEQMNDLPVPGTRVTLADVVAVLRFHGFPLRTGYAGIVVEVRRGERQYELTLRQRFDQPGLLFLVDVPCGASVSLGEAVHLAARRNRDEPLATIEVDCDTRSMRSRAYLPIHEADLEPPLLLRCIDAAVGAAHRLAEALAMTPPGKETA